jgi:hypothetical protein
MRATSKRRRGGWGAAVLVALLLAGAPARAESGRAWYVPDHAKLQLAGNVGFLSPGVGYAIGRRLEGDVFFGWVPEAVGGDDIFSLTGKITWAPWALQAGAWRIRPGTLAFQVTYTFGDEYFVIPDFAFTPTALRAGFALGAAASRPVRGHDVGLYAELVALDLGLAYALSDSRALDPWDAFSLALGARVRF